MGDKGKPGMRLGSNELVCRIGKGGNSEVWRATSGDDETVVKILRRSEASRIRRFLDEIAFHKRYHDDGVLPLLESDTEGDVKWFSMPPATNIRDALKDGRSAQWVIDVVAGYAETLARLAAQGVSHRDLKPENLFLSGEKPVIGDFGLVDFPEKSEITGDGELVGPLHYHALETLTHPRTVDGKAADVWSLAKTLWVLLTGQMFPLPGEYRRGAPYDLGDWTSHPRIVELNDLVIHCTRLSPADRPSMASVAEALRAAVIVPAEQRDDATLEELRQRFIELTQPSVDAVNEAQMLKNRLGEADVVLTSHVGAVGLELLNLLEGRFQEHAAEADYASIVFGELRTQRVHHVIARNTMLYMPGGAGLKIVHSVRASLLDPSGRMYLYVYFALIEHYGGRDEPLVEWKERFEVSLGSTEFENALACIRVEVQNRHLEVVRKSNDVIVRPGKESPGWFQDKTSSAG